MEKTKTYPVVSPKEFLSRTAAFYFDKGFSIALWRLPGSSSLHFAASDRPQWITDVNLEESNSGFLFAPFRPSNKKVHLPADEYFVFESDQLILAAGRNSEEILSAFTKDSSGQIIAKTNVLNGSYYSLQRTEETSDKDFFMQLVERSRDEILKGRFEKIVPSRSKTIELPDGFELTDAFLKTCGQNPNAMVTVFSCPLTGTWLGATPELLVSVGKDQHFRTVAVAATQPMKDGVDLKSVTWTQKDIEEQALVERYIIGCFKKIRLREFDEHGPRTVVAGNILHLKTEFDVDMVATNFPQLGSVMLNLLHPTSAVCGKPMEDSMKFLEENENYDRAFYSGYLGPVNVLQESHIYVNLRCMQLFPKHGTLYAGAGVMADSDPEKEWMETGMKMNTLLKIIRE